MSLSSFAEPIGSKLVRSLESISARNPDGYRRMLDAAGNLEVFLDLGDEKLTIVITDGLVKIKPGIGPEPGARITTDSQTIEAIIQGETTLNGAVLDGSLEVKGSVEMLIRLNDGLQAYVGAAVRTPGHDQHLFA